MENLFCQRLKALRLEKEISQAKLAVMFDVTQQTVNKWEHNQSEPTYDTLRKLAVFFDVTTDYLLGLSNDITK